MGKPSTLFQMGHEPEKKSTIEEQLEAAGLPAPSTEYLFAREIGRRWAFDFAWPSLRLAVEIEGAAFGRVIRVFSGVEHRRGAQIPISNKTIRVGGRHNTGQGMQADCEKYSWAAILGWTVVRATTTMVRDGQAIELVREAFRRRQS